MKQKLTHLALAFLLLAALGCGTSEDPVDEIKEIETPMGALQGEVESVEGVSIQVRLLKAGQLVSQAEAHGNYELAELEEGDYTIQISAKGFETVEMNVTVVAGQTVSLDKVTLEVLAEPVSHLRGVLTDSETGAPLSDVLVQLTNKAGEEYETLTTKDGVFTFENLPIDQAFTLTVMHKGYEDNQIDVDPISANETFELDVELTAIPEPEKLDPGQGLSIGSQAPEFQLLDSNSNQHALADYIGSKKVVIVFYRGGW